MTKKQMMMDLITKLGHEHKAVIAFCSLVEDGYPMPTIAKAYINALELYDRI